MSEGFSADWLALREPADHAARDAGLAAAAAATLAEKRTPHIVDLGCGAGSNLRGFAPALGPRQRWTLVDYDPRLLAAAREALTRWADRAVVEPDGLRLEKAGKLIDVAFRQADLAADPAAPLAGEVDLVTAAALFDLVSQEWLERFADALATRRLPLYTVLIYDGIERWSPPYAADAAALAAFHAHQATDKGFGLALGPQAAPAFDAALARRGYRVRRARSPWRLTAADAPLIRELADGAARAIAETGRLPAADVESWRIARRAASACEIGHEDLLATPR
ncbi:MAG: class I SAM-dependent methyltransferase [Methylobacteriaceae bacterium]|nr:class I SAM-dependent methyltransferase [Methylobacteriaceae bacterium]